MVFGPLAHQRYNVSVEKKTSLSMLVHYTTWFSTPLMAFVYIIAPKTLIWRRI